MSRRCFTCAPAECLCTEYKTFKPKVKMRNHYFVVYQRGLPVYITPHEANAAREAKERAVPGAPTRVGVVDHMYYLDEITNIQLTDWETTTDEFPEIIITQEE